MQKSVFLNILRWIILLPASYIGSRLVVVLLNLINPIIQATNNLPFAANTANSINFIAEYIISAYVLICIADYIAPHHKKITNWVVSSIFSALYLSILLFTLYVDTNGITPLADKIGAVVSCITMFSTSLYFYKESEEKK